MTHHWPVHFLQLHFFSSFLRDERKRWDLNLGKAISRPPLPPLATPIVGGGLERELVGTAQIFDIFWEMLVWSSSIVKFHRLTRRRPDHHLPKTSNNILAVLVQFPRNR